MTNVALVARKLAVLEEHLRRLTERRPAALAALRADTLLQDAISASLGAPWPCSFSDSLQVLEAPQR